jgi:hypothetical protein
MGQTIDVTADVIGEVAVFDTNRSVTGQDGGSFASAAATANQPGLAAEMAARLFAHDPAIDHVFVASNGVTVRRPDGWTDDRVIATSDVIAGFFIFYDEA